MNEFDSVLAWPSAGEAVVEEPGHREDSRHRLQRFGLMPRRHSRPSRVCFDGRGATTDASNTVIQLPIPGLYPQPATGRTPAPGSVMVRD